MFSPEIRKIYFNHAPKYQERIKKQLRDNKYIMDVMSKNKDKMKIDSAATMELCDQDFRERVHRSGATKLYSEKAKQRFYNKFYHLKINEDFVTYCVVPEKKQRMITLSIIRPLRTSRGIVYILHNQSKNLFSFMHSHVVRRYGERFNGTTNLTECLNMLGKELAHVKINSLFELTPIELFKRGMAATPLNIVIGSGILLADGIPQEDCDIHFIRTYVPMSMLNDRQDSLHEDLWNEIMEERKQLKVKVPLL